MLVLYIYLSIMIIFVYTYLHCYAFVSCQFCSSSSVCSLSGFVSGLGWFSVVICVLFSCGSGSMVVLVSGGMSSLVQLVLQAGHRFRLCGIPCCRQT